MTMDHKESHRLSVGRCVATGALSLASLYGLIWIGGFFVPQAQHRFVRLFTSADVTSALALVEGAGFALFFGAIAGAILASLYNCLAVVDREA